MDISEQAKTFLELSVDKNGFLDRARVKAVLEYIDANVPESARAALLKKYAARLRVLADRQTAVIASAGALSAETLVALSEKIAKRAGGKLRVKTVVDKSLVAGVRVKIGDDVFERSARDFFGEIAKI